MQTLISYGTVVQENATTGCLWSKRAKLPSKEENISYRESQLLDYPCVFSCCQFRLFFTEKYLKELSISGWPAASGLINENVESILRQWIPSRMYGRDPFDDVNSGWNVWWQWWQWCKISWLKRDFCQNLGTKSSVLPTLDRLRYLFAPVQTIFPELNIRAVVLGSLIRIMTAANRFGLYSAFLAWSAICFSSSLQPRFTVHTMFLKEDIGCDYVCSFRCLFVSFGLHQASMEANKTTF